MLWRATDRRPYLIGKPQPEMAHLAIEQSDFVTDEAVIVGDRLYTDIACGINAGISTVFVLSGEGTLQDVQNSDTKPEYIYKNIRELYEDIAK